MSSPAAAQAVVRVRSDSKGRRLERAVEPDQSLRGLKSGGKCPGSVHKIGILGMQPKILVPNDGLGIPVSCRIANVVPLETIRLPFEREREAFYSMGGNNIWIVVLF